MIFLGLDLGTSSVKVLATNKQGVILSEGSASYQVNYKNVSWAEQNPQDWWEASKKALIQTINALGHRKHEIVALGLSGQMHGLVALDNDQNVLHPAILWCDQRAVKECSEIEKDLKGTLLRDILGNKPLTGFTAPKIKWLSLNRPDIFNKISKILLPKDYIRWCLTGDFATDYSDASGTLMLDIKNKRWSIEMCQYLSIDASQLPRIVESYEVTGMISKHLLEAFGLKESVIVVGGAGDQAASAIGTGTVQQGNVSVALGTSGVVFAPLNQFYLDDKMRLHSFCDGTGKHHVMGVMLSAANCLKWWHEKIHPNTSVETLLNEADESMQKALSLVFLPYLIGERTPYADDLARGTWIGMNPSTNRGMMTRALLEGVVFGLKDSLTILTEMNLDIDEIRVSGGGSQSDLWCQIMADIFGIKVCRVNTKDSSAMGACILAKVGSNPDQSVVDVCKEWIKVTDTFTPNPAKSLMYKKRYKAYQQLYIRLKDWFANYSDL